MDLATLPHRRDQGIARLAAALSVAALTLGVASAVVLALLPLLPVLAGALVLARRGGRYVRGILDTGRRLWPSPSVGRRSAQERRRMRPQLGAPA
jgi:hypothetical protein